MFSLITKQVSFKSFSISRWIHDYQDACVDKLERFMRGELNSYRSALSVKSDPPSTPNILNKVNAPTYQRMHSNDSSKGSNGDTSSRPDWLEPHARYYAHYFYVNFQTRIVYSDKDPFYLFQETSCPSFTMSFISHNMSGIHFLLHANTLPPHPLSQASQVFESLSILAQSHVLASPHQPQVSTTPPQGSRQHACPCP